MLTLLNFVQFFKCAPDEESNEDDDDDEIPR